MPVKSLKSGEISLQQSGDPCMLDILKVKKPLKDSCFSEAQINMLFLLWKDFLIERFSSDTQSVAQAKQQVNELYSNAMSAREKYDVMRLQKVGEEQKPLLGEHEKKWVMSNQNVNPFIAFVRTQPAVMEDLRMCFKPPLTHNQDLRLGDMTAVMLRFVYWLADNRKTKVNLLGIEDLYEHTDSNAILAGSNVDNMLGNLEANWANARFHVALLNSGQSWRAVLIDRQHHTFEYYDPKGRVLDLTQQNELSQNVRALLTRAEAMDQKLVTKTSEKVKRGFQKRKECGVYVLLFLKSRIVNGQSFTKFAQHLRARDQQCQDLKPLFFDVVTRKPKKSTKLDMKYGAYDVRLATLEFGRYLQYLTEIAPGQRGQLERAQQELLSKAAQPGRYQDVNALAQQVQALAFSLVPREFVVFAGSNVWLHALQDVVNDPFTTYLRSLTKGRRAQSTERQALANKVYLSLVGWTRLVGADPAQAERVNMYMQNVINQYYLPLLHFNADNRRTFEVGMEPVAFVRLCMATKPRVSFGVHFLRDVAKFLRFQMQMQVDSVLDQPQFRNQAQVLKPAATSNFQQIQTYVNKCQGAMQRAKQLLQQAFVRYSAVEKQRAPLPLPPVKLTNPDLLEVQLNNLILQNEQDLRTRRFLENGKVQPWNFPLNVGAFQNVFPNARLPKEFQVYSVSDRNIRQLLTSEQFKLHYAIDVLLVQHYVQQGLLTNVDTLRIVIMSLIQFYQQTAPSSADRQTWCTLIQLIYEAVSRSSLLGLEDLSAYLFRYHNTCQGQGNMNSPFMRKVQARYQTLQ